MNDWQCGRQIIQQYKVIYIIPRYEHNRLSNKQTQDRSSAPAWSVAGKLFNKVKVIYIIPRYG